MKAIIKLIKNLFKDTEVAEATPYQFEYDNPIEGFNEFHNNIKEWRSK